MMIFEFNVVKVLSYWSSYTELTACLKKLTALIEKLHVPMMYVTHCIATPKCAVIINIH